MPSLARAVLLLAALPALALAQGAPPPPPDGPPPPPPPAMESAPPEAAPPPAPQAAAPAGEWVWTQQYGWLWMPAGRDYVYVPPDPQLYPEMYVYYPVYGWRWVVAPWVYGYGPQPRWGPGGVAAFSWYSHPWFRVGGYRGWGGWRGWGPYRGWMGPRVWGARGWAGAPPYYRTGVGERHPIRAPGHEGHRGGGGHHGR